MPKSRDDNSPEYLFRNEILGEFYHPNAVADYSKNFDQWSWDNHHQQWRKNVGGMQIGKQKYSSVYRIKKKTMRYEE